MSEALADGVGLKVIEQFEDAEQQRNAGQLGMWAWLLTELLGMSQSEVERLAEEGVI